MSIKIKTIDKYDYDLYDSCGNAAKGVLEINSMIIPLCENCMNELISEVEKFKNTTFCYMCEEFVHKKSTCYGSCKKEARKYGVELKESDIGYSFYKPMIGTCDNAKRKQDTD